MKSILKYTLLFFMGVNHSTYSNYSFNTPALKNKTSVLLKKNDTTAIARRKSHYLEHPQKGNLTKDREGIHKKAQVPKGRKGEDNSGITLAFGIDLAAGFSTNRARLKIVNAINAKGYLRNWILRVPTKRGEEARIWLRKTGNESPILNKAQINHLYEFGYRFFLNRAKKRLMGTTGYPIADVIPKYRLTEQEYTDLALDSNNPEQDYIYEFLADIAWNSNQFARGRQNLIAQALKVDNDTLSPVDIQIIQLNALRVLIAEKKIPTSRSGRINRLGWIDSKVALLRSQN